MLSRLSLFCLVLFLTACGGSGGDGDPATAVGSDEAVSVGVEVEGLIGVLVLKYEDPDQDQDSGQSQDGEEINQARRFKIEGFEDEAPTVEEIDGDDEIDSSQDDVAAEESNESEGSENEENTNVSSDQEQSEDAPKVYTHVLKLDRSLVGKSFLFEIESMPAGLDCKIINGDIVIGANDQATPRIQCVDRFIPELVGGTVRGLNGELTLALKDQTLVVKSDGPVVFKEPLDLGTPYTVSVERQPVSDSLKQFCVVSNGQGLARPGLSKSFYVSCRDLDEDLPLGGRLEGLVGTLVLEVNTNEPEPEEEQGQEPDDGSAPAIDEEAKPGCAIPKTNEGAEEGSEAASESKDKNNTLTLTEDGMFEFCEDLTPGVQYNVAIKEAPAGQVCRITNSVGYVIAQSAFDLFVRCDMLPATTFLGGTVNNLMAEQQLILDDGHWPVTISENGRFYFSHLYNLNDSYRVLGSYQPQGQHCFVSPSSGVLSSDSRHALHVNCISIVSDLSLSVSIDGLGGTENLELQLETWLDEDRELSTERRIYDLGDGNFQVLTNDLRTGQKFELSILDQPDGLACELPSATGHMRTSDVHNVAISCTPRSLSGTIRAPGNLVQDWDTNDPNSYGDRNNDYLDSAQAIYSTDVVFGFISSTGTGHAEDRFNTAGDILDIYEVQLDARDELVLDAKATATSKQGERSFFQTDIGLFLYDVVDYELVDYAMYKEGDHEVRAPKAGRYILEIKAFGGSEPDKATVATYKMSVSEPDSTSGQDAAVRFVSGEAIVTYKDSQDGVGGSEFAGRAQLVKFDSEDASSATEGSAEESSSESASDSMLRELSEQNSESYRARKTLENVKQLALSENVAHVSPNFVISSAFIPNDPLFSDQWHYQNINLSEAWDLTTGVPVSGDVVVAVLDTGAKLDHVDLAGRFVQGYDFVSDLDGRGDGDGIDSDPTDPGDPFDIANSSWHGTHVAGTIAANGNNGIGVAGVSWGAKLMPIRVIGKKDDPNRDTGTLYDLMQGLLYAGGLENDSGTVPAKPADIINMSLGGYGYSQPMADLLSQLSEQGVIVIASAGNEATNQLSFPASYPGVYSVSATGPTDQYASYSNFGCRIDIAAPGGDDSFGEFVLSTLVGTAVNSVFDDYGYAQGTSMAAPHVSGVAALMKAVYPQLTSETFGYMLRSGKLTVDLGASGRDDDYGYGLIDAGKAVRSAMNVANGTEALIPLSSFDACANSIRLSQVFRSADVYAQRPTPTSNLQSIEVSAPWLEIKNVNAGSSGYGRYRAYLVRSEDPGAGIHYATITFEGDEGIDTFVSVKYDNRHSQGVLRIDAPYVALFDQDGNEVLRQKSSKNEFGEITFQFEGVLNGTYGLTAFLDTDMDAYENELNGDYSNEQAENLLEIGIGGHITDIEVDVGL